MIDLKEVNPKIEMLKKKAEPLLKVIKKISEDDCPGLAAEMAFTIMLTLFPVLLLFVSLLGYFQPPWMISQIASIAGKVLPPEIYSPLGATIEKIVWQKNRGLFTLSLFSSALSFAGIFIIIHKAQYRIYLNTRNRFFIKSQIRSLILVVLLSVLMLIYFYAIYYGWKGIISIFNKYYLWRHEPKLAWFKYPLSFAGVFTASLLVYRITIPEKGSFRLALPGAVFMALLWVFVSVWFTLILKYQGPNAEYRRAYEVIAKMIAMILWMYINSLLFLIGSEINYFYSVIHPAKSKKWNISRIRKWVKTQKK